MFEQFTRAIAEDVALDSHSGIFSAWPFNPCVLLVVLRILKLIYHRLFILRPSL